MVRQGEVQGLAGLAGGRGCVKGLRYRGVLGWQKKGSIHEPCHLWLPKGLGLINDQASWEDVRMQILSLSLHPNLPLSFVKG